MTAKVVRMTLNEIVSDLRPVLLKSNVPSGESPLGIAQRSVPGGKSSERELIVKLWLTGRKPVAILISVLFQYWRNYSLTCGHSKKVLRGTGDVF